MLEHGREQFSSSIHSAVYVNYLSGAGGHGELGVELTEREEGRNQPTLIIVMETIEPRPPSSNSSVSCR